MPDCPHLHVQDSGLEAFRDIIREKTDGGRTIVEFLTDAAEGSLPGFEPEHRIHASEILARYGFNVPANPGQQHDDPKPRRSSASTGASVPALKKPGDTDPAIDDFAQTIRDETKNGLTIVRNLIEIMEAREEPYKPHHNLRAARRLIENGFPLTDALLCPSECTHHTNRHSGEGRNPEEQGGSTEGETAPDPAWIETLREIKRMEDEGEIDKVDYDPFKPVYDWAPKEAVMPYADEVAAEFRAELDLRAERRASWPEIEERRRKKLEQIYPSHSDDASENADPPDP